MFIKNINVNFKYSRIEIVKNWLKNYYNSLLPSNPQKHFWYYYYFFLFFVGLLGCFQSLFCKTRKLEKRGQKFQN